MKRVARISCDVGVLKIEYASWIIKKKKTVASASRSKGGKQKMIRYKRNSTS